MALPRSFFLAALCTACQAIPEGSPPPTPAPIQVLAPNRGAEDAHELAVRIREAVPARFYEGSPARLRRLWVELHGCGESAVLDRLEEVWGVEQRLGSPDAGSADAGLMRLVELLFEPRPGAPPLRAGSLGSAASEPWPGYPALVLDGLPYLLPADQGSAGGPPTASKALRWARLQGRLRAPPARPRKHPLEAVEQWIGSPNCRVALEALDSGATERTRRMNWWKLALRTQALRALPQSVLAPVGRELGYPAAYLSPRAASWPTTSALLRGQAVYWSEPLGFTAVELTASYRTD